MDCCSPRLCISGECIQQGVSRERLKEIQAGHQWKYTDPISNTHEEEMEPLDLSLRPPRHLDDPRPLQEMPLCLVKSCNCQSTTQRRGVPSRPLFYDWSARMEDSMLAGENKSDRPQSCPTTFSVPSNWTQNVFSGRNTDPKFIRHREPFSGSATPEFTPGRSNENYPNLTRHLLHGRESRGGGEAFGECPASDSQTGRMDQGEVDRGGDCAEKTALSCNKQKPATESVPDDSDMAPDGDSGTDNRKVTALDYLISKYLVQNVDVPYKPCNTKIRELLDSGKTKICFMDLIELQIEKSFTVQG